MPPGANSAKSPPTVRPAKPPLALMLRAPELLTVKLPPRFADKSVTAFVPPWSRMTAPLPVLLIVNC